MKGQNSKINSENEGSSIAETVFSNLSNTASYLSSLSLFKTSTLVAEDNHQKLLEKLKENEKEAVETGSQIDLINEALHQYNQDAEAAHKALMVLNKDDLSANNSVVYSSNNDKLQELILLLGTYPQFPDINLALETLTTYMDERSEHHANVMSLAETILPELNEKLKELQLNSQKTCIGLQVRK